MSGVNLGPEARRVTVVGVKYPVAMVRDGLGREYEVRVDLRPKGTGVPAVGEVWVAQRSSEITWRLVSQVGSAPPPAVTGSRTAADPVTLSLLAALVRLGLVTDSTSP